MSRRLTLATLLLCAASLLASTRARAQESSSSSDSTASTAARTLDSPAPDAPSAALRDLLAAACAHNESSFAKFLTARNAESFARLTASARIELMKRFVLLDEPGNPASSANPSGRLTVRCTTPSGAAGLQLGGAEIHDNIAIIPLDVRDVSEAPGGDPHHIQMGMVRENSSWKILSIGMLFLDLPSLEIEWDQASIGSNEQRALNDLKTVAESIEAYRRTYSRLPDSLTKLGHAAVGKASADAAGLLEASLVAGRSDGYLFRMVIVGASDLGAPAQYELSATPATYGRTGKLSFFRDATGKYHAADHQGAVGHSLDPVVE